MTRYLPYLLILLCLFIGHKYEPASCECCDWEGSMCDRCGKVVV